MEIKKEEEEESKVTCLFDKNQEELDTKIVKIFESYLERNNLKNT